MNTQDVLLAFPFGLEWTSYALEVAIVALMS